MVDSRLEAELIVRLLSADGVPAVVGPRPDGTVEVLVAPEDADAAARVLAPG